jgi:hypothetical protein
MSEATTKENETLAENVLLEWTGIGAKHIATEAGNAFLIPGAVTPVPVAIWAIARPWNLPLIITDKNTVSEEHLKHGRLLEHYVKAETSEVPEKRGPGGKVTEEARVVTKITGAKDLQDLPDSEARKLLDKIVDIAVLQGYLDNPELDAFPGLKGAIERRITTVEEKGKGKGKK